MILARVYQEEKTSIISARVLQEGATAVILALLYQENKTSVISAQDFQGGKTPAISALVYQGDETSAIRHRHIKEIRHLSSQHSCIIRAKGQKKTEGKVARGHC